MEVDMHKCLFHVGISRVVKEKLNSVLGQYESIEPLLTDGQKAEAARLLIEAIMNGATAWATEKDARLEAKYGPLWSNKK